MSVMDEVHRTFERWMILPSMSPIDLVAGTIMATRMPGPPIFLMIIGPSGSGKSEIVEAADELKNVYPMSDMTPQSLLSGKMTEEGSFLLKLPKNQPVVFTFKDFTTILNSRSEDRRKIMAQLREIYDGSTRKIFGGVPTKVWKGKVSLIGASTSMYDEISRDFSAFGERYLLHRPQSADRMQVALKAGREAREVEAMKKDLKRAFKLIDSLKAPASIPIDEEIRHYLGQLSDFVTHLRSVVPRDPYKRDVIGPPQLEEPGRFSKQVHQLIRGVTAVRERPEPYEDEVDLMDEVAMSCVPPLRLNVIREMPYGGASIRELEEWTKMPKTVVHRTIEDLRLLGLVEGNNPAIPAKRYELFFQTAKRLAQ